MTENIISRTVKGYDQLLALSSRSPGRRRLSYWAAYTLVFSVICFFVYFPFLYFHKSLIWSADGLDQHFVSLRYYGSWLRDIIRTLFETGQLNPKMWDFTMGQGSDVLSILSYYTIGDPLCLLSVFVPQRHTEIAYILLIFVRFYLSGLAFSAFCFYFKKGQGRFSVLLGSMVYIFCGYIFFYGVRHPFFTLPLIYFPLLLMGIEKIFRKEGALFFILAVFISGASNFYFFYMLVILMFLYAVIRFFDYHKEKIVVNIFKRLGQFIFYFAMGMLLAAAIFLPTMYAFLGNGRVGSGGNYASLWTMPFNRYIITPVRLLITPFNGSFAAVIIAAIFMLNRKKEEFRHLKIQLLICVLFMLVPFFGYALNGFNYVSERWIFACAFVLAYVFVLMTPEFFKASVKDIALSSAGFAVLLIFGMIEASNTSREMLFSYVGYAAFLLLIVLMHIVRQNGTDKKKVLVFGRLAMTVVVVVSLIVSGSFVYHFNYGGYMGEFTELTFPSTPTKTFEESPAVMLDEIQDDSFYRADVSTVNNVFNQPVLMEYNGLSAFFSTLDGGFYKYSLSVNSLYSGQMPSRFVGLQRRTALNTLASVKYFANNSNDGEPIPYGYVKIKEKENYRTKAMDALYENPNALPLGYTYDAYILSEEYEKLSPADRQEVMLEAAVLDTPPGAGRLSDYQNHPNAVEIPYTIEPVKDIEIDGNTFTAKSTSSKFRMKFEGLPGCETYIRFKNLNFEFIDYKDHQELFLGKNPNAYDEKRFQIQNRYRSRNNTLSISARTEDTNQYIFYRSKENPFSSDVHDYMLNLGYHEEGLSESEISMSAYGDMTVDELSVVCVPMDGFEDKINKLKADSLQNTTIGKNTVSGEIDLKEDKILLLSIPYAKGWKATVNGEPMELEKANVMYMALPLKAGHNAVELTYQTPFLVTGFAISGVSLLCLIVFMVIKKIKRKKEGHAQ